MKENMDEIIKDYLKELGNVEKYENERKKLMDMVFWEYENNNTHLYEDRDSKIFKIIQEKHVYPSSFLGSSLGFNKATIEHKFLDILTKFKLDKKPTIPSPKNCIEFEKLKYLLIKLNEMSSKSYKK